MLDALIKWNKELIKEQDVLGRTPLHYAVENRDVVAIRKLLDNDKSVAYVTAGKDEGNTALHVATAKGEIDVMEELLSRCPDCWEILNSKGRNILHISADLERDEATEYISRQKWAINLANRKDHEGNTPMHVLAHKGNKKLFSRFPGVDRKAANNDGLTPLDILLPKIGFLQNWLLRKRFLRNLDKMDQREKGKTTPDQPGPKKEGTPETQPKDPVGHTAGDQGKDQGSKEPHEHKISIERFETLVDTFVREARETKAAEDAGKMTDIHMIVATLISTMSFTAGFTIPGGYHGDTDPDKGTAVLVREAAFKAFVITNTIAVVCSTSSVFLYVSASLFNTSGREGQRRARRHAIAFGLIITAMPAMMVAFSTGAYAVLSHSLGLAIVTCVIGCCSSIVYAVELRKQFSEEIADFVDSSRSLGGYVLDVLSDIMHSLCDGCRECIRNPVSSVKGLLHRDREPGRKYTTPMGRV